MTITDYELYMKIYAMRAKFSISRVNSIVGLLPTFQRVSNEFLTTLAILEKISRSGETNIVMIHDT